jgi:hypothetical protein
MCHPASRASVHGVKPRRVGYRHIWLQRRSDLVSLGSSVRQGLRDASRVWVWNFNTLASTSVGSIDGSRMGPWRRSVVARSRRGGESLGDGAGDRDRLVRHGAWARHGRTRRASASAHKGARPRGFTHCPGLRRVQWTPSRPSVPSSDHWLFMQLASVSSGMTDAAIIRQ